MQAFDFHITFLPGQGMNYTTENSEKCEILRIIMFQSAHYSGSCRSAQLTDMQLVSSIMKPSIWKHPGKASPLLNLATLVFAQHMPSLTWNVPQDCLPYGELGGPH
ncbi:Hypothetical predicted protein [Podarcis lilfordi]|uniref:Uncharacterized protein n=1 Tax=Podarcis lilfordi TaxID=74358 RepID=A0AA35KFB7_9SAUR|nr:Hypothetical predicted protein [Podarcis lilfordi]